MNKYSLEEFTNLKDMISNSVTGIYTSYLLEILDKYINNAYLYSINKDIRSLNNRKTSQNLDFRFSTL